MSYDTIAERRRIGGILEAGWSEKTCSICGKHRNDIGKGGVCSACLIEMRATVTG